MKKPGLLIAMCIVFAAALLANGCQNETKQKEHFDFGNYDFSIHVGGVERKYVVHVPPGYDVGKPVPMVIMFHGGGGTARSEMIHTDWASKADQEGFLVVFPEGTSPDPTQPGDFLKNPQTWNDGSGRHYAGMVEADDVGFTSAMLDELLATFAVESKRIYATGFSNGASMACRVGVSLQQRIAAVAALGGHLLLQEIELERPVSLLSIFGMDDPLNPPEGGEINFGAVYQQPPIEKSVLQWTEALGCMPEPEIIYDHNGVRAVSFAHCREDAEVILYTVEGLGHVWPGGKNLLPESWVGKPSDKLKANDVVWEFFEKHPMR
jgi:polyhydroxybutyrate depolymerase